MLIQYEKLEENKRKEEEVLRHYEEVYQVDMGYLFYTTDSNSHCV